jgi:hypothetical protein
MGAYLVYKLYKLIDKLLRKKPFKHDIGTIHRRTTHDTRGTHTHDTQHSWRARRAHGTHTLLTIDCLVVD